MDQNRPVEDTNATQEIRDALIALAITERPKPSEDPPSDEDIAALVEHRLSPEQRKEILEKLDCHPDAYQDWLTLAAEYEQQATRQTASHHKRLAPWAWATAALAAGIVIFVIWFGLQRDPPIEAWLAQNFEEIAERPQSPDTVIPLPWPKEPPKYGFSDSGENQIDKRAFGAGYWYGWQELLGNPNNAEIPDFLAPERKTDREPREIWLTSKSAEYFRLGEWVVALKSACLPGYIFPSDFWKRQLSILGYFNAYLAVTVQTQTSAQRIQQSLVKINTLVERAVTTESNYNPCRQIQPELNFITTVLMPLPPTY
ncbi:MAG: hypothetical protein V3U75_12045 [Methylococcaceae bacterium]